MVRTASPAPRADAPVPAGERRAAGRGEQLPGGRAAGGRLPDPRPLDPSTRARVRTAVAELGPVPAVRIAALLGLTGPAVRRHLDALVAEGVVVAREAAAQRRGRGRPAREYVLSSAGHEVLPAGYDDLAVAALDFLATSAGPDAVAAFADQRAGALEASLAGQVPRTGPVAARVEALAAALAGRGYAASARPVARGTPAEGVQLCQGHCPVQRVAQAFPQLCEAERRAFERLLGTRVQRLATLAQGAHVCTAHVATADLPPTVPEALDHPGSASGPADSQHRTATHVAGPQTPTEGPRP